MPMYIYLKCKKEKEKKKKPQIKITFKTHPFSIYKTLKIHVDITTIVLCQSLFATN